jgi:hypothetical protein
MAKPLGDKSRIIRAAITGNPDKGNKALAALLNDSQDRKNDNLTFAPEDVAKQKQAMKKPGALKVSAGSGVAQTGKPRKKPGRKPNAARAANAAPASRTVQATTLDLIDGVLTLANQCGGIGELKRLVDRMARG